jgi:hypothetical protein
MTWDWVTHGKVDGVESIEKLAAMAKPGTVAIVASENDLENDMISDYWTGVVNGTPAMYLGTEETMRKWCERNSV